ncbi:MAG: DMT family transporter [Ectothiorhodospiraceae bacterium]|nr:DMT family transporter [Ectothiorhodospiraceae bacterium]
MDERTRSLLAVHVGMLLLGGTALFSKIIPLPAVDITAWRSVFAAIALLCLLLVTRHAVRLREPRDYAIVRGLGVLFTVHWVTYFHAMQVSTVATGIVALFTFPVMTVFLEPLLYGTRARGVDVVSALVVLFGVYLMVPEFSLDNDTTIGVFWGLVSALFYASRNALQRRYFIHYPGKVAMFYQVLVVVALTLPFSSGQEGELGLEVWGLLLVLGVVFTALPHTLFANALVHFRAATVGLINCLQVFYATVFAAVLLSEVPGYYTIIGGLLVVGAAAMESLRASR